MYLRKEHWLDALAHELTLSRDRPFDWGTNDCLQFVGRCIEAQSGVNPLQDTLGCYHTPSGALRALRRAYGVRLPVDFADKAWGPRMPIAMARMGDIAIAAAGEPAGMGPVVGICYGRNSLFVGTHDGVPGLVKLETLTLEHCYQPWASSSKP